MDTQNIEFSLIQNAIDSIERAVELLAWKNVNNEGPRLKQAIVVTAHATELLLKERLQHVHPSLVWEDVGKYPRLGTRTVGVDEAISRLSQRGGITLKDTDAKIVKSLRTTRNAIEHFIWKTTREEANLIVGQGLSFAIQFAATELGTDIAHRFRADDTWDQLLYEHSAFARAHAERIEQANASAGTLAEECSFCIAIARDITTGACSLCGHWELPNDPDDERPC